MKRNLKPYSFPEDYGFTYRFGIASDESKAKFFDSVLEKIFPPVVTEAHVDDDDSSDSSSESSESDSNDDDFPEAHHCQIYSCKDPECFSCELASSCYNCGHCAVNKSLQLPCFDCKSPDVHSLAVHKEIRCTYHKEFPKLPTPQFTVCHDPSQVAQSKFVAVDSEPITNTQPLLINDREKLAEYIALKNVDGLETRNTLLRTVLDRTYSQCGVNHQFHPQIDLNVDTSKFERKPLVVPKEIQMPLIIKPPVMTQGKPREQGAVGESDGISRVVDDNDTKRDQVTKSTQDKVNCDVNSSDVCKCFKVEDETCVFPGEHLISRDPCVLCAKAHSNPCKCHKQMRLLEKRKTDANEAIDLLIANHTRTCYDNHCPLRDQQMNEESITKWFDTLAKLERCMFQCPLTVTDFTPLGVPQDVNHDDGTLHTYLTNYLPRPVFPGQKRSNGVSKMKFWDRLNSFQEQFTDHSLSTNTPLISGITKSIFDDDDEAIHGRYDDVYTYWDRNKIFIPKKILVKKPETLVKLIETNDLPLKFEALYALNRSARENKILQDGCGQKKVIEHLLDVLDSCDHDGIRRLAIYILSMAVRHPSGRCVFFELGKDTLTNLFKHYLTDTRYGMRRAYMLVLSNLLEDTGVNAILCNAVTFENTFANMCEKDPDLQIYLMKMIFHAMHDIEGRDKLVALPEFRLTPVLSGCISKKSRVREIALDLLDTIVSFCKQDVVIKTFKDVRGIKVLNRILRKPYMAYAHPVVLKIYEQLAEDPEAGPAIKEGSLANLVEFVDTIDNPKLIAHTLRVLVKMARDPLTKEVLALTNVITKVAPLLVHTNEELAQSVLMIIELMAAKGSRNLITQQLVKADPMVDLLWVVGSENRGWDTRVIALRCIIALLNLSPFFGECYIRCKNATNVINLLCHQAKFLTTYSKTLLVQVLSVLAKSKRNYEFLIRNKAVKALLYSFKCFDSFESQLYAHSVGLLAYMMKDRRAVIQFSNVKNSWNLIAKKFMEKKFISADILMNLMFLVTDLTDNFELGAKAFMNNGFLRWMIDLEEIYPEMSGSIRNAIDSIIRNYLPLKFAHQGFLSYQDYTNKSLFFVTKDTYNVYKDKQPFPMFDKGISNKLQPEKPIYYFNLPHSMRGASSEDLGKELQIETSDNFEMYATVSRSADSVHKPSGSNEDEEKFIPLEVDTKLEEMFKQVKECIARRHIDSPPQNQQDKRVNEILGIAKTVVMSMTGFDPTVPITRQIQEIYLESLKKHLGSNIYAIGRLVMGYKFERAVLFKALADALDIPCWLQRTGSKTAWNEVYVPPEDGYHGGELLPNHVIDLMSPDPQLLPVKSREAKLYISNVDD